jgi:hypothetical protein
MHSFARPRNGFEYLGIMETFDPEIVQQGFARLLDTRYRKELFQRLSRFDFTANKSMVVQRILGLFSDPQAGS